MKSLVFLLFLLAPFISCDDVPVFLWGKPSTTYLPALSELRSGEFQALVSSQIDEDTVTLVFVEEKLSTEDLSRCKLQTQTCFKNLQNIKQKSYFANVEEPFESLFKSEEPTKIFDLGVDGSLSEKIEPTGGDVYFFNLQSKDYSINDVTINKIYSDLSKQYSNILAIYTAKVSSVLKRKTRQVESADPAAEIKSAPASKEDTLKDSKQQPEAVEYVRRPIYYSSLNSLIYLEHVSYREGDNGQLNVITTTSASDTLTESNGRVTLTVAGTPKNIVFTMELSAGTWSLTGLKLDETEFLMLPLISVNEGLSYYCNTTLTFISPDSSDFTNSVKINIVGMQLQPNFTTSTQQMTEFGDAYDCTGFTSPAIWGGIFVVFLLLFIISVGISWMMDINTMDRFDDPKGKTIIVSATD